MIPIVNGKHEWFGARGLYNGLVLLGDVSTGSYWDHITGECVHGELKGTQLEFSDYDLLYTTVANATQTHPQAQLATATNPSLWGRLFSRFSQFVRSKMGQRLPPWFTRTMGTEDTRRKRMDIGLGLWTKTIQRYYPLETIQARSSGILGEIDGQTVFIYYNEQAKAPDAFYIPAKNAQQTDDGFVFDTGERLQQGKLLDTKGQAIVLQRPQQMFTRWYGFAYTFPNCDIYESERVAQRV